MKIKVYKASNWNYEKEVEINTLEELIKFRKECGNDIIIQEEFNSNKLAIMIYDDYIE